MANRTSLLSLVPLVALACGVAACSGDDTNDPEDAGTDQSAVDASVDTGTDSGKDAGKDSTVADATPDAPKDSAADGTASDGATDGASEAGDAGDAGDAGLPPSGTPCNPPSAVQQQDCGLCGFQKRACLPGGDGGYVWGDWGFCQNQVVNGCDPKLSYPDSACGNCGTKKTVCLNNCNYDQSQACNEPPNACKPQSTEFVLGLSCDGGGRERLCDNQCQFGNFGACQSGPTIPGLIASGTVNTTVQGTFVLPASPTLERISSFSACPTTLSSTKTPYVYISVKNPTVQTLTASIWSAKAPNGSSLDTIMAVYSGPVPPANNDQTARKACVGQTNDNCNDTTGTPLSCQGGSTGFAGLMKGDSAAVVIPPNGTVVVYLSVYSSGTGDVLLAVRTDALN